MSSDEDSEVLLLLGGRHERRSINRKNFNVNTCQDGPIKDMAPAKNCPLCPSLRSLLPLSFHAVAWQDDTTES